MENVLLFTQKGKKMSLNPVEWTRAQQLLLEILQTVSPIASGNPSFRSAGVVFKKNLFIPPQGDSFSLSPKFPYAVRLLSQLKSAREEMTDLLETLPAEPEEKVPGNEVQRGIPKATKGSEEKNPPKADSQIKEPEKMQKPRSFGEEKQSPEKMEGTPTQKNLPLGEKEKTNSQRSEKKPEPTVSKQAVRLIDQVRDAIRNLSHSGNLIDPQPGPLRDALKRLKPMIDALIEAVSQSDMHTPSDGLAPKTQFVLPKLDREHLKIPFPHQKEGTKKETPSIRSATIQRQSSDPVVPKEIAKVREESIQKPAPKDLATSNKMLPQNPMSVPSKPNPQPPLSTPIPYVEVRVAIKNQDADPDSQPAEKVSLPAAPFTPELTRSNTSQKKKRKRFWSRNSKEEDEEKDQRF